ncbi:MAG: hypothetical protein LBJ00_04870 [Planctomycetaceae bacterium]|nr:hypothetical protein [Planctomycetaceae bacterium]
MELNTQAQQREAVVQKRRLPPHRLRYNTHTSYGIGFGKFLKSYLPKTLPKTNYFKFGRFSANRNRPNSNKINF